MIDDPTMKWRHHIASLLAIIDARSCADPRNELIEMLADGWIADAKADLAEFHAPEGPAVQPAASSGGAA